MRASSVRTSGSTCFRRRTVAPAVRPSPGRPSTSTRDRPHVPPPRACGAPPDFHHLRCIIIDMNAARALHAGTEADEDRRMRRCPCPMATGRRRRCGWSCSTSPRTPAARSARSPSGRVSPRVSCRRRSSGCGSTARSRPTPTHEDGRRTLVRVVAEFAQMRATQTMPPIDDELAGALGPATAEELQETSRPRSRSLAERLIARYAQPTPTMPGGSMIQTPIRSRGRLRHHDVPAAGAGRPGADRRHSCCTSAARHS